MRRTAFANLADAIAKAVSKSHANGPAKGDRIHESGAAAEKDRASKKFPFFNDNHKYAAFKEKVLAQYGSAASCFAKFSGKDGMMSRKDFKVPSSDSFLVVRQSLHYSQKLVSQLENFEINDAERKSLRKQIGDSSKKTITLECFSRFVTASSSVNAQSGDGCNQLLAPLPSEVPELPAAFKSRPHAAEQLLLALLDSTGEGKTAVTAPKSRVSSQGMGGVGKTMLTCSVVRDARVREAFECIAWVNLSQVISPNKTI